MVAFLKNSSLVTFCAFLLNSLVYVLLILFDLKKHYFITNIKK